MNRMILAAAVAAIGLAGCGAAGGKAALINSCAKEGTDKKVCTCTVTEMEKNMDKKAFAAMAKAAAKGGEMGNAMNDIPPDQQMAAAVAAMGAAMKCGLGGSS